MPSKDDSFLKNKKDDEFSYFDKEKNFTGDSIDKLNKIIKDCTQTKPALAQSLKELVTKYATTKACYYYNGIPRNKYKITGNPFDKVLKPDQERLVEEYISPELFAKMISELKQLSGHLNKANVEKDMTVWRRMPYETFSKLMLSKGINFPNLEEESNIKEGDLRDELDKALKDMASKQPVLCDHGFTSTTLETGGSWFFGNVAIELFVPKGTSGGIEVNSTMDNPIECEQEVLFPTNTKMKFKKGIVKGGKYKKVKTKNPVLYIWASIVN